MRLQLNDRRGPSRAWSWIFVVSLAAAPWCMASDAGVGETVSDAMPPKDGYVARQDGLRGFFQAVAAHLGKPIIVNKAAAARQVTGNFAFDKGDIVGRICRQLGLVSYHDGNAIYIYDASETRNGMMVLKHIRVSDVTRFLRRSGLADPRYPLRGDGDSTFYVAGPPIYVETVLRTAESMDVEQPLTQEQRVEVIRLNNTFVSDRSFNRREEAVVIPGIAAIVERLLSDDGKHGALASDSESVRGAAVRPPAGGFAAAVAPAMAVRQGALLAPLAAAVPAPAITTAAHLPTKSFASTPDKPQRMGDVRVIAYPETNSLLVRGTTEQIRFVRDMVRALDEEKRHVELALWIIDVEKDDLDQLGVKWRGQVSAGALGATINGGGINSFSAIEGDRFTAAILALTRDSRANIVSRPVVLTQENVPAMFDSNRTFYTQLIAERAVDLQHVTYGTAVHVLPRFTAKDEIELSLNIEDGGEVRHVGEREGALPVVSRTTISTVARVPKGRSLLVGGYTRGENGEQLAKIPFLGDLPLIGGAFRYRETLSKNAVRVFLIRPREITEGLALDVPPIEDAIDAQAVIGKLAQQQSTEDAVPEQALFEDVSSDDMLLEEMDDVY